MEIREINNRGSEYFPMMEKVRGVRHKKKLVGSMPAATTLLGVAGALMILGGIAGFLGIPAAFEKTKSRFRLIAPVLFCLCFAVGAEVLCRMLGRGDSYSALAAAFFAVLQLALVVPGKKTT